MILEEQRFLHEDLERLENAIADRVGEEPRLARDRLNRDHQVAKFLERIESQSKRLLEIYEDAEDARTQELQAIGTGEPLEEFYKQLGEIKSFHQKYPNELVENLERAYRKPPPGEGAGLEIDTMFTGEEAYGKFFDLTSLHEKYLNLPSIKRLSYLQYLDNFDIFAPPLCPIKRPEKTTDQYFSYVGELAAYLEDFMRRTRPLENLEKLLESFDGDFEKVWAADDIPGWTIEGSSNGLDGASESKWCPDCEKEFKNENVYKGHLDGKKHKRAAEARAARQANGEEENETGVANNGSNALRLKERVVAEREYRIRRLAAAMSEQRSDTRTNVERRQGMTERERQQELDALFAETTVSAETANEVDSDSDDDDEKVYNPLKLPLAWDGKPIPFWLYKLHGLGVEFPCEICGNFVYMGRRAFDKHFNEARHIYGLKCLGITNTTLFREITNIQDALKLWDKIQREKRAHGSTEGGVVQMEDGEGNVMPEKVYNDLKHQGLI